MFSARVEPATADAIAVEAERRDMSRGALLDDIVAKHLRKRKA